MPQNEEALKLNHKLETSGAKTLKLFRDLKDQQWDVQVYSDGPAWKVHNLLAHFVETESAIPRLIRKILNGEEGIAEDFDLDEYNDRTVRAMNQFSHAELQREFKLRREATINMVQQMSSKDLHSWGRHPFLGKSQVKTMIKLMFLHISIHERDIRSALSNSK